MDWYDGARQMRAMIAAVRGYAVSQELNQNRLALLEEPPGVSSDFALHEAPSADRDAVLEQLERLLDSTAFRTSKRNPRFLRYVVQQTLDGRGSSIKERVIAVEVFDRPADYDSSVDPIVRVAAGDIRKRLAQYYVQPEHQAELRIDLAPGSYVPAFVWPQKHPDPPGTEPHPVVTRPGELGATAEEFASVRTVGRNAYSVRSLAVVLFTVLLLAAVVGLYRQKHSDAAVVAFWSPVLSGTSPALVLLPDVESVRGVPTPAKDSDPSLVSWIVGANHVAYGDVTALVNVTDAFHQGRNPFRVLMAQTVEFSELRAQPLVLIGGLDNPWTTRLQAGTRFTFELGAVPTSLWIRDAHSVDPSRWTMDFSKHLSSLTRDFGIVTRFTSKSVDQPTIIIAGMGPYATTAASEFITNPRYFAEFIHSAPKGWENKNVQIVIQTEVISGQSGPPYLVGYDVW